MLPVHEVTAGRQRDKNAECDYFFNKSHFYAIFESIDQLATSGGDAPVFRRFCTVADAIDGTSL
ncbi:hypothetical protein [Duganella sp. Leaf61]|uniref:hypothetical protein n=1 Tax=Duganella sp. Leaf61 TaxID=1736227 RepID=UPI00138EE083|nr:hypothetical protein [Duganella sp. Leaf61]